LAASDTLTDRISLRARRANVSVDAIELDQLRRYCELLERWNRTINLTSLPLDGFPDPTVDRLIIEPLLAAPYVGRDVLEWVDLGSGGGSPALPLKIKASHARLTMLESRERKAAFLREVLRILELPSATVAAVRFDEFQPAARADLITVRAVRLDTTVFDAAAAVLKIGGQLMRFRTDNAAEFGDRRFELARQVPFKQLPGGLTILKKIAER
jgi:16S rRNA (guanine527-N7)-methyltransferase